jgi:hypothetical protein
LLRRASSGGVWIERSERTTKTDDLNALSDAELAAIVRQGVQDPESKKMNWPQHWFKTAADNPRMLPWNDFVTVHFLYYYAISLIVILGKISMNTARLKLVERSVMRPVASKGRKTNKAYRTREHLTEAEMDRLLAALKANRHGHRDWLIGLLI